MNKVVAFGLKITGTKKTIDELTKVELRLKEVSKQIREAGKSGNTDGYAKLRQEQIKLREEGARLRSEIKLQEKAFLNRKLPADSLIRLRQEYRQLTRAVSKLSAEERKSPFGQKLIKDTNKVKTQILKVDKSIKSFTSNIGNYGSALDGVFSSIKGSFLVAGLTVGLNEVKDVIVDSVETFTSFEDVIAQVGAISGASATQIDQLRESALAIGAASQLTAEQVGQLQLSYSRLGFSVDQILAATEATKNLAIATGSDLNEAAQIVGKSINAYGLEASQASEVTDIFAAALNTSALELNSLSEASKLIAPVSNTLGVSLAESTAAIGLLSDQGLEGTLATTTIGTALQRLADDTKKYSKVAADLNIEIFDQEGAFVGLANLMKNVETATKDMTEQQRLATISQIFGQNAAKNFAALLNAQKEVIIDGNKVLASGADALDLYTQRLEASGGEAERTSKKVENTLGQDIKKLNSALETAQIRIVGVFNDTLRGLIQFGTRIVGVFEEAFLFIIDAISPAINAITKFYGTLFEGSKIGNLFNNTLKFIGSTLVAIGNTLAFAFNQATLLIQSFRSIIKETPALNNIFEGIRQGVSNLFVAIGALPAVLNGLVEAYKQTISNIKNLDFSESITDAFKQGFEDARAFTRQARESTKKAGEEAKKQGIKSFSSAGKNSGSAFNDNLSKELSKNKKVIDAAEGSISEIRKRISDLKKVLEGSVDSNVIEQTLKQINSAESELSRIEQKVNKLRSQIQGERERFAEPLAQIGTIQPTVQSDGTQSEQQKLDAIELVKQQRIKAAQESFDKEKDLLDALALIELEADRQTLEARLQNEELSLSERLRLQNELGAKRIEIDRATNQRIIAQQQELFQEVKKIGDLLINGVGQALGAINELQNSRNQAEIQDLERRYETEIDLAEGNAEEIAELEAERDAAIEKIQREQFERNKKLQIASAIASGAQGILSVLAARPGTADVVSLGAIRAIQIAITAGITAAQIGAISATQFQNGGILKGASHKSGGVPLVRKGRQIAEAEGGEAIINKRTSSNKKARNVLSYLNQKGGGKKFGGAIPNELKTSIDKYLGNVSSINPNAFIKSTYSGVFQDGGVIGTIPQITNPNPPQASSDPQMTNALESLKSTFELEQQKTRDSFSARITGLEDQIRVITEDNTRLNQRLKESANRKSK